MKNMVDLLGLNSSLAIAAKKASLFLKISFFLLCMPNLGVLDKIARTSKSPIVPPYINSRKNV